MMKTAKLIIDGKEIEISISQEAIEKLFPPKKKTGYERVSDKEAYYYIDYDGCIDAEKDFHGIQEENIYSTANYYSDLVVAENNARADKLMRQLRRFAVEHREKELDWSFGTSQNKYKILYDSMEKQITIGGNTTVNNYPAIYFDSQENAKLAIDTFKDELFWYFTEYQDSL